MKLDYAALISPYPVYLSGIGHLKSPTLKEIWNSNVTYNGYNLYISLFLMDLQTYCIKVNPKLSDWFYSLADDEKAQCNMFNIISEDEGFREQYRQALEFFFVESVIWDDNIRTYFTYTEKDMNGQIIPIGIIQNSSWNEIINVILQLNSIRRKADELKPRFKSKLAQEVWELTHSQEKKEQQNKDMELPNMISSIAAKDQSLNILNIWDLTVYQLYDQFQRQEGIAYFEISSMRVAAWGDTENKFNGGAWHQNIYEN